MKLIATLGNTQTNFEHNYKIGDSKLKAKLSFLALKSYYDIKNSDVFIIGTNETEKNLGHLLGDFNFINVDKLTTDKSSDSEVVFGLIFDIAKDEISTILDLTQGFRHIPMILLISSLYADHLKECNIKEIFYAKTTNASEIPSRQSCNFEFVLLTHYIDLSNIATIIETFKSSAIVPKLNTKNEELKKIVLRLQKLSNYIFSNNVQKSILEAKEILNSLKNHNFIYLEGLINSLKDDIQTIVDIEDKDEFMKLYSFGRYLFSKNLLLQSLTLLYESMLAFIESEVRKLNLKAMYKDKECLEERYTFDRRNCLKKFVLEDKENLNKNSTIFDGKYKKLLRDVDRFRNEMAHAFTGDELNANPKSKIQSFYDRFLNFI